MPKPEVVVVGSYNTDLMARTPRMPAKGETILGGPFSSGPGGKGANQAVAAARLAAEVSMVVKLGTDRFGDQAVENLKKECIDTTYVYRSEEAHTGVALILVDDEGENMIVVASGTNALLRPEDVDPARDTLRAADVALFQLESPLDTVSHAIGLAHDVGTTVLLNPAPGRPLDRALLAHVDVLTPNQTEMSLIAGADAYTPEQAEEAARRLLAQGVGAVVVTLGGDGAMVVTPELTERVPGFEVDVVDTTGAGDAFNGALAVALAEDRDLIEAVRFANAAAALQVTKVGTAPAMPYRADVSKFLASFDAAILMQDR